MPRLFSEDNPNWKGGNVRRTCTKCDKEYFVPPGRSKSVCCSLKCWNQIQKEIGNPSVKATPEKVLLRIMKKTAVKRNGCIEWTGSTSVDGYARTSYQGRGWTCHRLVWHIKNGAIETGKCILHSCDNRCCVNIEHMRIGTHAENISEMVLKGRSKFCGQKGKSILARR